MDNMKRQKQFIPINFSVDTLIDVGVGYGTPWLYSEVKYNRLILIEPNIDFNNHMKKINGTVYNVGVGAKKSETILNINSNKPTMSSIHTRTIKEPPKGEIKKRKIPIITLDEIMEKEKISKSVFLKIDTEGYELEVIKGAIKLLSITEGVIAETSRVERFENSYTSEELFDFMKSCGFLHRKILRTTNNWWDVLFYKG